MNQVLCHLSTWEVIWSLHYKPLSVLLNQVFTEYGQQHGMLKLFSSLCEDVKTADGFPFMAE